MDGNQRAGQNEEQNREVRSALETRAADALQTAWDEASAVYQARRALSTHVVSLGGQVPDALGLELLGDVRGLRILDVGCGGGQNSLALARQGAWVTGIDFSRVQIDHALALARAEGIVAAFFAANGTALGSLADGSWDIVLAAAVLHYLPNADAAIVQAAQALRPGGRLILSIDHPVRTLFYEDLEEGMVGFPVRDYFTAQYVDWRFADTSVIMRTWHHPVGDWVAMLVAAGLRLVHLIEPPTPPELLDALWPVDDALSPLRHVPHSLVMVAEKPTADKHA